MFILSYQDPNIDQEAETDLDPDTDLGQGTRPRPRPRPRSRPRTRPRPWKGAKTIKCYVHFILALSFYF